MLSVHDDETLMQPISEVLCMLIGGVTPGIFTNSFMRLICNRGFKTNAECLTIFDGFSERPVWSVDGRTFDDVVDGQDHKVGAVLSFYYQLQLARKDLQLPELAVFGNRLQLGSNLWHIALMLDKIACDGPIVKMMNVAFSQSDGKMQSDLLNAGQTFKWWSEFLRCRVDMPYWPKRYKNSENFLNYVHDDKEFSSNFEVLDWLTDMRMTRFKSDVRGGYGDCSLVSYFTNERSVIGDVSRRDAESSINSLGANLSYISVGDKYVGDESVMSPSDAYAMNMYEEEMANAIDDDHVSESGYSDFY